MKSFKHWAAAVWILLACTSLAMRLGGFTLDHIANVPLCLFRFWTGIPCPGCGMTHALLAAFQGHWKRSFDYHPLGIPLLVIWTAWLLLAALSPDYGRKLYEWKRFRRWSEAIALAAIVITYAFKIL